MFGFDERYAMFDITPVENQFILDYLPDAKGDYVKVYLYGLMRCYHPEEDMSLARMSHELNMTEEDVAAAFRYWERRRLVRRISDNPPQWKYINIIQKNLVSDDDIDPEYQEFSNGIYEAFDKVRHLHGSEISACFEWHEGMKIPTEIIIMLLNHMVEIKGKNFNIKDAEKTAMKMYEEKIQTIDAAEDFFYRDGIAYKGVKKILKLLGKRYLPSEAQVGLYRKWTQEWGFTQETIEAAVEMTAKGDPSLGYLDGILNRIRCENNGGVETTPETIDLEKKRTEGLKEILFQIGHGDVNPTNLELYEKMKMIYPQEVIIIAARECALSGKDISDVLKLLQSWKKKGFETKEDIDKYISEYHYQKNFIRDLRKMWGMDEKRAGTIDRKMLSKWENEYGFNFEMIKTAAIYAVEAKQPMVYLDKILEYYKENGITTPEQAKEDHERKRAHSLRKTEKILPAQDFTQRDYSNVQKQIEEEQRKRIMERLNKNGGKSDA